VADSAARTADAETIGASTAEFVATIISSEPAACRRREYLKRGNDL
jgi:hypothetical protein